MKIALNKLFENFLNFDFGNLNIGFEHIHSFNRQLIYASVESIGNKALPIYDPVEDKWYGYEEDDDWMEDQLLEINIYDHGTFSFGIMGDPETVCEFNIYNPTELKDFFQILPYSSNNRLKNHAGFKELSLIKAIDELFISITINNSIKFLSLAEFRMILEPSIFEKLIECVFTGDYKFLVEISNWELFCSDVKIERFSEKFLDINEVPILIHDNVLSNSHIKIEPIYPYLGIRVNENFSSQYLLDYLSQSKEGEILLDELKRSILNNRSYNSLIISAPAAKIDQFKYSTEFRMQFQVYKNEITSDQNHTQESVIDLKNLYKNRRENIKKFVLNRSNSSLLDILRNPLPYNLEKSYRTYARAANELDRLSFAGKLYNLILRSIVFYPLEEMLYLGLDQKYPEIAEINEEIRNDKPISDGTWLQFFNVIAATLGKNKEIKLQYFSPLVKAVQAEYNTIRELIPQRNDWAHYREHSAQFLKTLDAFIPKILSVLRHALKKNQILLIESQNYQRDGLYIRAKKIMGYEVDIETIEFKTSLEGRSFIQDSLVVYRQGADYTIPLDNFFAVRLVQAESIQMGIFKGGSDTENNFEY